jgi:hypothetical protein
MAHAVNCTGKDPLQKFRCDIMHVIKPDAGPTLLSQQKVLGHDLSKAWHGWGYGYRTASRQDDEPKGGP